MMERMVSRTTNLRESGSSGDTEKRHRIKTFGGGGCGTLCIRFFQFYNMVCHHPGAHGGHAGTTEKYAGTTEMYTHDHMSSSVPDR